MYKSIIIAIFTLILIVDVNAEEDYGRQVLIKTSNNDPKVLEAYDLCEAGRKFMIKSDYENAVSKFEKAIKLDPTGKKTARAYMHNCIVPGLAYCYQQLGRNKEALKMWELSMVVAPERSYSHISGINSVLKNMKSEDEYIKDLEERFSAGHVEMGPFLIEAYIYRQVQIYFEKLRELKREGYPVLVGVIASNDLIKAINVAKVCINKYPNLLNKFIGKSPMFHEFSILPCKDKTLSVEIQKEFNATKPENFDQKVFYSAILVRMREFELPANYFVSQLQADISPEKRQKVIYILEAVFKTDLVDYDKNINKSTLWANWLKNSEYRKK